MEVIVYSSTGCPKCMEVKDQLKKWGVTFEERNISENAEYFKQLQERRIFGTPATMIDGKVVLGFQPKKLQERLGISEESLQAAQSPTNIESKSQPQSSLFTTVEPGILQQEYDFVIIGGGPAGASAAVYASRAKLNTLLIDKSPQSGTLAITHKIANYPGVLGELTGLELVEIMQKQAKSFGTTLVQSQVLSVELDQDPKQIILPEGTIKAKSVFIAVGARAAGSKLSGEEEFTGRGVSYCSTCDAAFYEGREVIVVGDQEEAIQETKALAKFCKLVHLFIPSGKVKGTSSLDDLEQLPNVRVYPRYRIKDIHGDDHVSGVKITNADKLEEEWKIDGVFLYMSGMKPGTDFLGDQVKRDAEGYVSVNEALETSVPGVYAGGDARKTQVKQAVLAAADGCLAALEAEKFVHGRKTVRPQYS